MTELDGELAEVRFWARERLQPFACARAALLEAKTEARRGGVLPRRFRHGGSAAHAAATRRRMVLQPRVRPTAHKT